MKLLFLHEFGRDSREWHMKRLADAMENHYTGVRVLYHSGFLKNYVAGGVAFRADR